MRRRPAATRGYPPGVPIVEVHHSIGPDLRTAVRSLFVAAERATGRQPLSDHLAIAFAGGEGDGFVAVTAVDDTTGDLLGYAQATAANEASAMEVVLEPETDDADRTLTGELVRATLDAVGERGGGAVNWLVFGAEAADETVARGLGMIPTRTLYQMRRPLPTGMEVTIDTRSIVVGADDAGWLDVNNRAFAGHGEQGGWTVEALRRRQAAQWFEADDVRVHEIDGRIAAFCWTKVHPATTVDPVLGEIYVIAVHPDHHGLGLGRQMTLAGLEHLTRRGITAGMLWVDADNTAAVGLYTKLGFSIAATTVAYSTDVPARSVNE